MEGKTLFVEIQKQVGAAHFVLPVEAVKDGKSLPFVVHPDKVTVQFGDGESVYRFPDGFRVRPKSCSGLKWFKGDRLHLRLSVVQEEAEEQKEEEDGRGEENGPDIKPGHTRMCCAMCGQELLKPSFCAKRVLPLPSDGWQEAVAHSFCHKSQDTQNMAAQTLAPRPADILTGTGHVLVHAKAIHSDNVDVIDSEDEMVLVPLVRCKRCRSQVGIGVTTGKKKKTAAQDTPGPPGAIKLYLSSITVHAEGSTCSPVTPGHASPGQDSVLAQQLLKESESQYCLRFVVQDLRADVYLLMWLLKSETRLMTISTQGSVSSRDILKILYLPLPRDGVNKLLLESWKKDENVGLLSYPRDTCLHLVSHLVSHTRSLPVSQRNMNNFMVGFLTLKNNSVSSKTT